MTAVIDYGAGNLHSVRNALASLGDDALISGNAEEILAADRVILPGVGSFGDAMARLRDTGLDRAIIEVAESGKPLLGICLGLHLMFESSEESKGIEGLGIFKGKCVKIPKRDNLKIPHMGWNSLSVAKPSKILKDLGSEPYMYFVHSYYIMPECEEIISAYTEYGGKLGIAVESDNVFATQFHPEKSGAAGLKILENFIRLR